MTVFQVYATLSVIMFIMLSVMLGGNHWVGQVLKIICICLALFGFATLIGTFGIVLPGSMRWI